MRAETETASCFNLGLAKLKLLVVGRTETTSSSSKSSSKALTRQNPTQKI